MENAATSTNRLKTAVVILNWNTKNFLEEFLPPTLSSMPEGAELIVADSASSDGSMEMLSEKFPAVRQIRLDKNYGFTGGYNRAFKAICDLPEAKDLDYFVLINSDIEVTSRWLEPLVQWMDSHPECGACGPKLLSWYDRKSFEYAGAAGGMLDKFGYPFCRGRVMKRVETDNGQYDTPAEVFWATGACLMVRKEDYAHSGGLDDRFFAHMEEIDLCWRLQLEGKKICVVPQSVVYHVGGGTLHNDSPLKLMLNYRNDLLMLENNLAKTYALKNVSRGIPAAEAAHDACRKARKTIFRRKILDGCSASVYLLTGKTKSFKAVIQAHKGFKKMRKGIDQAEVQAFAESHKGIAAPALYPRWIVITAMVKGDGIFNYLKESI